MAKGRKASLVQCRIEACNKIDEIKDRDESSVQAAMKLLAGEEGIPLGTLKYWYYMDEESRKSKVLEVQPPKVPGKTAKSKAKVINKIVDNISKAQAKDEEDALAAQANRDGAMSLADELGGAIVAEELYDLFLKKAYEVDRVIEANKELEAPMDASKVIDQLLRMARNAGWKEDEQFCPSCEYEQGKTNKTTRTVTYKVSCSDRTCENHVEKQKKTTTKK